MSALLLYFQLINPAAWSWATRRCWRSLPRTGRGRSSTVCSSTRWTPSTTHVAFIISHLGLFRLKSQKLLCLWRCNCSRRQTRKRNIWSTSDGFYWINNIIFITEYSRGALDEQDVRPHSTCDSLSFCLPLRTRPSPPLTRPSPPLTRPSPSSDPPITSSDHHLLWPAHPLFGPTHPLRPARHPPSGIVWVFCPLFHYLVGCFNHISRGVNW